MQDLSELSEEKCADEFARHVLFCRMACFSLEEFQTARAAFEAGSKLDPKNSQYKTWIRKCDAELAG